MKKGFYPFLLIMLITSVLIGCKESEPKPSSPPTLTGGMSQDEVRAILGKPNGSMTINNETTLLYGGIQLKFMDDHLVPLSEDVKNQVDQRIAGNQPEQNVTAPAPKKRSIMSAVKPAPTKKPPPGKVTHPLAIKGKKAMYDAARASYMRECAVTGNSASDFPSFEEWLDEN